MVEGYINQITDETAAIYGKVKNQLRKRGDDLCIKQLSKYIKIMMVNGFS